VHVRYLKSWRGGSLAECRTAQQNGESDPRGYSSHIPALLDLESERMRQLPTRPRTIRVPVNNGSRFYDDYFLDAGRTILLLGKRIQIALACWK
jgi:hypothetical protein